MISELEKAKDIEDIQIDCNSLSKFEQSNFFNKYARKQDAINCINIYLNEPIVENISVQLLQQTVWFIFFM